MSVEEELAEASLVAAGQRERIEDLEQLIRDYDALLEARWPCTYNTVENWFSLQQRMRELGIMREARTSR